MGKKDEFMVKHNIVFNGEILSIEEKAIQFDDYTILSVVNNGANAVVLKARGNIANEIVAIKIWVPDERADRLEQSVNEIKKMAKLNAEEYSKSLIRYYASGCTNGFYYCIMEYLDTNNYITLKERQKENMVLNERYQILMNIVSGLRCTQESMIFHGDLHSENILINKRDSSIKLIDFGTSFRNQLYSKKRDNIMTFELAKTLLNEEWDSRLIVFYNTTIECLPQNAVRLIVKALAKIVVLLDFWKYGNVETVVEDIALFATLVPFFNIKYLVNCLFKEREVPEYYKKIFKEKIIVELYCKTMDVEFDEIEEVYAESQRRFIVLCESNPLEREIYRDSNQAKIFNGPLYEKYFAEDEEARAKMEIEKEIE